jgi:hypothetical protein
MFLGVTGTAKGLYGYGWDRCGIMHSAVKL